MRRFRSLAVALLAAAAAVALLRRRRQGAFVEVEFEDGSAVRLGSRSEARDLLGDVRAVLALVA